MLSFNLFEVIERLISQINETVAQILASHINVAEKCLQLFVVSIPVTFVAMSTRNWLSSWLYATGIAQVRGYFSEVHHISHITPDAVAVSVEALVFIVIRHSCSDGSAIDSRYRSASFLRLNSQPIMWSPYCAIWNKWVRLLSVLKLWPLVETSAMSENDGITVRQTEEPTIQLWPHGLGTPCVSRLSRRKTH